MVNTLSHTNNFTLIALRALRALSDVTPDLIFYKDMQGVYLGCNQAFCEFLGGRKESDIIGASDCDLFGQELADFYREKESAMLRSNSIQQFDEWVTYPDGSKVLLNTLKTPFLDLQGNVIGVVGISRDITNSHRAQAALQENEERYRHLFEASEDSMSLIVDKRFVVANLAAAKLLGYESEKALAGIHPAELSPEFQDDGLASYEKAEAMIASAFKKGFHRFEWTHKKNNGDTFPVEVSLTRIPYDARQALLCIWRDISERKQLELLEKRRGDILEIIATKDELSDTLKSICLSVEQQEPDLLCSILLLDNEGKHLLTGAAPSLPDFYNDATHGMAIGMEAGSCAAAAFTGKRVIVKDIQKHPFWTPYKELARKADLLSCWSEPIRSSQGKLLGTFAIYHRYPHQPTEARIQLIEQTARLVSLAIEKHQTRLALKSSEERWAFAIEGSGDGVWDWDIQTGIIIFSKRWKEMLGYGEHEIASSKQQWLDRVHPEDKEIVSEHIQAYLEGKLPTYVITYRLRCKDGSYKWILGRGMAVRRDDNHKPLRMVGTHTDITELKQTQEKLKLAEGIFSHAREGITITDSEGSILDVNDTFTEITGYSREEVLGKNPRILQSGMQSPDFYTEMWATLLREGSWTGEIWNRRKTGEVYAERLSISAIHNSNTGTINYVGHFNDISEQKAYKTQLQRIEHYDVLTNLPNRVLMTDRLSQAMGNVGHDKRSIVVLYLDIDEFTIINDQHGRHVGDKLLIAISHKLKAALRGGDTLARVGGDEFVAMLTGIETTQDYVPILERLLQAASSPFTIDKKTIQVSASIGLTIHPQDSVGADILIRHADQAMYIAKQEGKNRYHLFDTALDYAAKIHHKSLDAIRLALHRQEFVLHYQPKVNMKTGAITGAEALIRWQHPERGLVPPNDFLPIIESNSLSIAVGEWVIDSALSQMAAWNALGFDLPVSINISAFQLQSDGFATRLAAQLAAYPELAPQSLELEVLETSELGDMSKVTDIMNTCIALGVSFALDDFGTGYASLSYIRRLPAQMIKIDQTFIRDMLVDVDDLAIVESIVALAKSFKRGVIAEGVETFEHGAKLLQLGCELAQGYGIARPMPAKDIPTWAETWRPDKDWS